MGGIKYTYSLNGDGLIVHRPCFHLKAMTTANEGILSGNKILKDLYLLKRPLTKTEKALKVEIRKSISSDKNYLKENEALWKNMCVGKKECPMDKFLK